MITRIDISANPGEPSTMWQAESGNVYRTLKEAKEDTGENTVNPDDYEIKTGWWVRNRRTVLISAGVCVFLAVVWFVIKKYIKK